MAPSAQFKNKYEFRQLSRVTGSLLDQLMHASTSSGVFLEKKQVNKIEIIYYVFYRC